MIIEDLLRFQDYETESMAYTRYLSCLFLAHAGTIDIWQEGQAIMMMKHEANRKRQDVPGELEEPDGIEGSLGGIEAG